MSPGKRHRYRDTPGGVRDLEVKSVHDRRVHAHPDLLEPIRDRGLDTLLTALYVELTDRIIPSRGFTRRGPGKPPDVTDAELVCIAVAQVLLRFDDERRWLRIAPRLIGHLFPRLLRQSEYNDRVKAAAPLMEAAVRWLAGATPGSEIDPDYLLERLDAGEDPAELLKPQAGTRPGTTPRANRRAITWRTL